MMLGLHVASHRVACLVVLLLVMLRLPRGLGVDPFIVFFPFCDQKEICVVAVL